MCRHSFSTGKSPTGYIVRALQEGISGPTGQWGLGNVNRQQPREISGRDTTCYRPLVRVINKIVCKSLRNEDLTTVGTAQQVADVAGLLT